MSIREEVECERESNEGGWDRTEKRRGTTQKGKRLKRGSG